VAIAVIMILMVAVVPTFVKVLADFDVEMPIYTRILIAVSGFFKFFHEPMKERYFLAHSLSSFL